MAIILEVLASIVGKKLIDATIKEMTSILAVKSEMKDLQTKMNKIKHLLVDAESKKIESQSIHLWLADFREVMYDTEDLLDDFQVHADKANPGRATSKGEKFKAKLRSLPGFSQLFSLPFRHEVVIRIKNINYRLERLSLGLLEKLCNVDEKVCSYSSSRMFDTSSKQLESDIVGIDHDAKKIVDWITEDTNQTESIFAITGMGGMGKTTLARKVFNLVKKEDCFNSTIWVHVSRNCTGEYLLTAILSSINEGDNHRTFDNFEQLSNRVTEILRGMSVFIVLDDVWESCVWEKYLRECLLYQRENYSTRILITTRNEEVAGAMKVSHMHPMRNMHLQDGWLMLCKNVFNEKDKSDMDMFEEMGKKIVEKCKGVPLAIKVVGGVLKMKDRTMFAWERVLSNDIWSMGNLPKDIEASLLLSYEDLPSHLKQCFTYFSVLPKWFSCSRQMVVNLWIAERFIEKLEGKDVVDSAEDCYNELLMRNLLQTIPINNHEFMVTMHDLLHSLTLYLSKKEYIYVQHNDTIKLRHLSLNNKDLDKVPEEIMKQDYLRTLFLWDNPRLKTFSCDLLSHLRRLHVLILSTTGIETLPEEFGTLVKLKYLSVSYTKLKKLPESIKNLKNLEVLFAWGLVDLHSLPMGIAELINLRILQLSPVYFMPTGLDRLKNIRIFRDFVVNDPTCSIEGSQEFTTNIKELKDMSQLTELTITKLERVVSKEEAEKAALDEKTRLEFLRLECTYKPFHKFENKDVEKIGKVLAGINVPKHLNRLHIYAYFGKVLPSHIFNAKSLGQLTFLILDSCFLVKQLPHLGDLPKLERLLILNAPAVRELGPEFFGSSKFPKLQFLQLKNMIILEKVFEVEQEAFPCLVRLLISECPTLKSLGGLQHANHLKTLEVENAGNLASVENFSSLSELTVVSNLKLTSVKNLPSLKVMKALDCPALMEVKDVGELNQLFVSAMDEEQRIAPEWVDNMSPLPKKTFLGKKIRGTSNLITGVASPSSSIENRR